MRQFRFVRKPLVVLKSCRAPSTSFTRSSLLRFGMALRCSRTYATPSFWERASLNTPMIRRSVGLSLSSRLHFSNAPTTEATDSPSSKKGSSCGFFSGKSIASRSRQSQHWRFSSSAEDRHGTKRQLTATNPRSISAAIIVEGRLFEQCRCTAFLLQVNAVVRNGVPSRGGWREPTGGHRRICSKSYATRRIRCAPPSSRRRLRTARARFLTSQFTENLFERRLAFALLVSV